MNPSTPDLRTDPTAAADRFVPVHLVVHLAVLAAAAGSLDVVCVTRLGGAFASIITGNVVQLGRGIAQPDGRLAVTASVAVLAYGLGVAAGTVGLRGQSARWSRRTTAVAGAEAVLLCGVAAGWLAIGGRPGAGAMLLLLALAGAAMGVQSVVTAGSGVRGASTTYLTGTFTTVVRALVSGDRRSAAVMGGARRLVALLCGAIAGAMLLRFAPLWAPVLPAILVGAVVAFAFNTARSAR